MKEEDFFRKLKKLRQLKPEKEWVFSLKEEILGREKRGFEIFPFFRPIYAFVFFLLLLTGIFQTAQKALPGETLYPLKKLTEKIEFALLPKEEKPKANLELLNKRLAELQKIAKMNEVKKLPPALNEFQANVSEVSKSLTKLRKVDKTVLEKTLEVEKTKKEVEKVLGTKLEEKESENPTKIVVKSMIEDLEKRTLSPEEKEIFEKAKEDFAKENYTEALIKILSLSK